MGCLRTSFDQRHGPVHVLLPPGLERRRLVGMRMYSYRAGRISWSQIRCETAARGRVESRHGRAPYHRTARVGCPRAAPGGDRFRRAMDLSLVLDQEGIAHELRRRAAEEEQWALAIGDGDASGRSRARRVRLENPLVPRRQEQPPRRRSRACGLPSFLRCSRSTSGRTPVRRLRMVRAGSADAAAILRGEWWRTVDCAHPARRRGACGGQRGPGGLLLALLARAVGSGVPAALVLLSACRDPRGRLAGAAGLRLHRRVHGRLRRSGALAASPSTGAAPGPARRRPGAAGRFSAPRKRADLAGHLCVFVRAVAGAVASGFPPRSRAAQIALSLAAALVRWLPVGRISLRLTVRRAAAALFAGK